MLEKRFEIWWNYLLEAPLSYYSIMCKEEKLDEVY
jgi:hypothetical protein